MFKSN